MEKIIIGLILALFSTVYLVWQVLSQKQQISSERTSQTLLEHINVLREQNKQLENSVFALKARVDSEFNNADTLIKLGVGHDEIASACEMSTTEVELIRALKQGTKEPS